MKLSDHLQQIELAFDTLMLSFDDIDPIQVIIMTCIQGVLDVTFPGAASFIKFLK
jgi:hypothetical protein